MAKTMIGPRLRQLRRKHKHTQAEMARLLGVSTSYVNLLENNQRSLSVQMLMALSDSYGVDWRDLVKDEAANVLADLRGTLRDPLFGSTSIDVQELRAAIDHAPRLVETFLGLYQSHRTALEKMMQLGPERMPDILATSPETVIHDFFRNHSNYFDTLERAAEHLREDEQCDADDIYVALKARLKARHGIAVRIATIEDMQESLPRLRRALRRHTPVRSARSPEPDLPARPRSLPRRAAARPR